MSNDEIIFLFHKLESIIGRGLDDSSGAVGLTREDGEKLTVLRDSAVFALAVIKCNKSNLIKKGGKKCEDDDAEADASENDVSDADAD